MPIFSYICYWFNFNLMRINLIFQDAQSTVQLGYRIEDLIFKLADTHLFFNEIEVSRRC